MEEDFRSAPDAALDSLLAAARAPLSQWLARYPGFRAMGTLCSYVPDELVHAAGLTPVRIRGSSAPLRRADAHLQPFTCALCRSSLDQVLAGDLHFLEGVVFAHTCDTMQAAADLWRWHDPAHRYLDTVMHPANLGAPSARAYLVAELERFRDRLAAHTGTPITETAMRESIDLYDETRRLVGELSRLRDRFGAAQLLGILDAAQVMPRERFNPILGGLLPHLEGRPRLPDGPRLLLVGAVLDEPGVAEVLDDLGARLAGDDLCTASRHFEGQVGASGAPIEALAEYHLRRTPCPTKLQPDHDPGQRLLELVGQAAADGVVIVLPKFCEPHAFDAARLRPRLERAGVPSLVLEMEHTPSLEGLRTRLQAFVEML